MSTRFEIDIDELVLHGVDPADRHAVAGALTRELTALVAAEGAGSLLSHTEGVARQDTGTIALHAGARPAELGAQIARTVHRGWR